MKLKGVQKGFTLIELVMVIAILGILSAVALPQFQNLQGAAREASTRGSLGAVRSALAIRFAHTAAAGGAAAFPGAPGGAGGLALAAVDFADGQIPRNALQGNVGPRGIELRTALPATGLVQSAANGFWYIAVGANAGRAGAYSDGVVNTAEW